MDTFIIGILIDSKNKKVIKIFIKGNDIAAIENALNCQNAQIGDTLANGDIVWVDEDYFLNTPRNETTFFQVESGKILGGNAIITHELGNDIGSPHTGLDIWLKTDFFDINEATKRLQYAKPTSTSVQ